MKYPRFASPLAAAGSLWLVALACSSDDTSSTDGQGGTTTGMGGSTATSTGTPTASVTGTNTTGTATSSAGPTTSGTSTSGSVTSTSTTGVGGATTGATVSTADTASSTSGGGTGSAGCADGQVDCAGTCVSGLATPIDRGGSYALEFGDTYFAAQAAGGKIVEFRSAAGSNLLTTSAVNDLNFGSTLWTAPQVDWDWPPPTALDSEAYTVTADDTAGTITMVSNGTPTPGPAVTVTKLFAADVCGGAVNITYTVTNSGESAVSISPWEVSRVIPGGLSFFGAEQTLLGDSQLTAEFITDTYWFDHMASSESGLKLFAEGTRGYVAFTNGSELFLRDWTDVPATAHPPAHGEVEVYEGAGYVELEVVGSYGSVAAGGSATLQVRWRVRPMPDGAQRTPGDAGLLAAVDALLAE